MEKIRDMEEMIEDCKKKQEPGEKMVFALGAGSIAPLPFDSPKVKKSKKQAVKYICNLDGFIGFHPIDLNSTMLLFETLNDAKGAKNLLDCEGYEVGILIPALVKDQYIEAVKKARKRFKR